MTRLVLVLSALFIGGCAPSVPEKRASAPTGESSGDGQQHALVATVSEDYATGALATVRLDDWAVDDTLVDVSGDPAVFFVGGTIYQLDRYLNDTVRTYAPGEYGAPEHEWALEEGANPHTVAWCDGLAVVVAYGRDQLTMWDNGLLQGTVDLSDYADADGIPEVSTAVVGDNGRLYLGAHQFDRDDGWSEAGGLVLEVDCAARAVTQSWDVPTPDVYANPGQPGTVLVAGRDDGIRTLDVETGTLSAPVVAPEAIPGTVSAMAAWGDHAVIALFDEDDHYSVHCATLGDGTVELIEARTNFLTTAVANDRGEVWVSARTHWADPTGETGTLVYDADRCASLTTQGAIPTLLAPFGITFY